ncbi:glycoside hydrolase family 108 protein [uncultured Winogradskyella sp.]|uniref:glycoside hydrolase family 108 protein n=1 Tax=uncultured Winogradskyella sp. TaxID=395353 RepID=UPI002607ECD0|nr:glycosyl hydrolase 108 family protein [uncultured Winogradskyella sp.]
MSNFLSFLPLLTAVEGGYQKDPDDSGNYNSLGQLVGTNYGISAPVYEDYLNRYPTESDMRNMKKSTADSIYKSLYWDKVKASQILSQPVANLLVDFAVNSGVPTAVKKLQDLLNYKFSKNLAVDGIIGPLSLNAINSVDSKTLFNEFKEVRKQFYKNIAVGSQAKFLSGWLKRLEKFVFEKKTLISTGMLFIILLIAIIKKNAR